MTRRILLAERVWEFLPVFTSAAYSASYANGFFVVGWWDWGGQSRSPFDVLHDLSGFPSRATFRPIKNALNF